MAPRLRRAILGTAVKHPRHPRHPTHPIPAVSRDTSFSYSFLVLPAPERRAIGIVWDFCRAVDDAADEATGEAAASVEVTMWRAEVGRLFGDDEPRTPQGRNLKPQIGQFALSRQPFDDLVDGVEMDLRPRRYASFDDLAAYCRRVASAVGLMCVEIFGCTDARSREYAVSLGLALQLTNIIRDVAVDCARGRIYLPEEDCARFGVTDEMILAGSVTAPVARLLEFECQRARQLFDAAARAMPADGAGRLVAAEIMGGIYSEILRRIERRGYDVFSSVVRVPRPVRARIALSIWARTRLSALAFRVSTTGSR